VVCVVLNVCVCGAQSWCVVVRMCWRSMCVSLHMCGLHIFSARDDVYGCLDMCLCGWASVRVGASVNVVVFGGVILVDRWRTRNLGVL